MIGFLNNFLEKLSLHVLVCLYMTFLLSMVYKGFFNRNSCATFRGMKCHVTGIGGSHFNNYWVFEYYLYVS